MRKLFFVIVMLSVTKLLVAQENNEWKTQTFFTGYFALNGEYINGLPSFEEVKGKNIGFNIGEASILSTIQPLEKLKINSVITYKPRLELSDIIAELSGEWQFTDQFLVKAGRFLLPLHPANSQYYAPMNYGVALPIFVTNHSLFPLNINGININGKFDLSDNFQLAYDFSGGQYSKMSRNEAGILGFFGRDGVYLNEDVNQVNSMITKIENTENGKYPKYFGTGGKFNFKFYNMLQLEIAAFYSQEELTKKPDPQTTYETDVDFLSYGTNVIFNYNKFNMKASAWYGNEKPEDKQHFEEYNIELYYGELSYSFDKITPYGKVEIINGRSKDWTRLTGGVNFRPLFETTFKLEYHRYLQDYVDDFDVIQISAVYSF